MKKLYQVALLLSILSVGSMSFGMWVGEREIYPRGSMNAIDVASQASRDSFFQLSKVGTYDEASATANTADGTYSSVLKVQDNAVYLPHEMRAPLVTDGVARVMIGGYITWSEVASQWVKYYLYGVQETSTGGVSI